MPSGAHAQTAVLANAVIPTSSFIQIDDLQFVLTGGVGAVVLSSVSATNGLPALTVSKNAAGVPTVTGGTALLLPNIFVNGSNLLLTLTQQSVSSAIGSAGTANQRAAAGAFDTALAANRTGFANALSGLDRLSTSSLRSSLDAISGSNNASLPTVTLMSGQAFLGQFNRFSAMARAGDNGAAIGRDGEASTGRQQYASLSGAPSQDPVANIIRPWSVWTSGYEQTGQLNGDGNVGRLNEMVAGSVVGADYKVRPDLRLGAAVGYGRTSYSVAGGSGGSSNNGEIGIYANYVHGRGYLDGELAFGHGGGEEHRDVSLPGSPAEAQADVASNEVLGGIETGYSLGIGRAALTPFAGLDFGTTWQNGFTETGASALDLMVNAQARSSVRSDLGLRLGGSMAIRRWTIIGEAQIGWAHEYASTGGSATEAFAAVPAASFTVAGAHVPTDSALVAAGFSIPIFAHGNLYLDYDGNIAPGSISHAFTAGIRYRL